MTFFIREKVTSVPNETRSIYSYEGALAAGDPYKRPRLVVDFDETSIPSNTCLKQTFTAQISSDNDDAEQRSGITLNGNVLNIDKDRVGLRFQNVLIPKGATVLSAEIDITAQGNNSNTSSVKIYGHDVNDSGAYDSSNDVTSRLSNKSTAANVTWSFANWSTNVVYTSPDIKTIVQEIINRGGWTPGNSLSILLDNVTGSGERRGYTYDNKPAKSVKLRIKIDEPLAGVGYVTVRQRLLQIVDDINLFKYTPIVDIMYEAGLYYRGDNVDLGRYRYTYQGSDNNPSTLFKSYQKNGRVSHPASYTGGSYNPTSDCDVNNLNTDNCADDSITGTPKYKSPITLGSSSECTGNYIILLSDGGANRHTSQDEIKTLTGKSSCISTSAYSNNSYGAGDKCGVEMAEFLHTVDQSTASVGANLSGEQTVTTHTIGFNLDSSDLLKDIAAAGGGEFFEAGNR